MPLFADLNPEERHRYETSRLQYREFLQWTGIAWSAWDDVGLSRGYRMKMIGISSAKSNNTFYFTTFQFKKVVFQLAPFVARNERMQQIVSLDIELKTQIIEKRDVKFL